MTIPIIRYAPGGDIFVSLANTYGYAAAQKVYEAALTGDYRNVSEAVGEVRNGPPLDDSTTSNFLDQITTDPLAAPLDGLNSQLGKAVWNVFKNPFVLLLVAGILFFQFGGAGLIRKWFKP